MQGVCSITADELQLMLIEPFPGTWGCAEHSALFSHLIPMIAHLIDEITEVQTGEITFPSYQLVSGSQVSKADSIC